MQNSWTFPSSPSHPILNTYLRNTGGLTLQFSNRLQSSCEHTVLHTTLDAYVIIFFFSTTFIEVWVEIIPGSNPHAVLLGAMIHMTTDPLQEIHHLKDQSIENLDTEFYCAADVHCFHEYLSHHFLAAKLAWLELYNQVLWITYNSIPSC